MKVDGGTALESARAQFDNWTEQVRERLPCPSLSVLGNHDIFWEDAQASPPRDPKSRGIEAFGMPGRYHAHVAGGWKFLMLDTFHADGCKIDAEQFGWLKGELADASRPVVVVSHAPILTATGFFEATSPGKGQYSVPYSWMIEDVSTLKDLFLAHPHVRLALSGHMHQVDRVDYQGVSYVCGGAVSGNWWANSQYLGFGPAYLTLDLASDGSFRHEVIFWE